MPPTGRPVTVAGITLFRIEDGKYVERWSEADFLGLLQQLAAVPA
jgi:predicted ester cyclase